MSQTPPENAFNPDSILDCVKKNLGLGWDYDAFDHDVITHINSVFSDLNQIGIGPPAGFMIEDRSDLWADYLQDDLNLNSVRSYMYLRVKLLFDSPATSYAITMQEKQIEKLEWRLNVHREATEWVDPMPVVEEVP